MTWRSAEDFAKETSAFMRFVRGMVRRLEVTLTSGSIWQLRGQRPGPSGGGDEVLKAEVFSGVGFFARAAGAAEAIAVAIGGPGSMAVVATRDEATRKKWDGQVPAGATAVFNPQAALIVKPDGTIVAKLLNGVEIPLALKLDLTILRSALSTAPIAVGANGAAAVVAACDVAATAAIATLVPPRAPGSPLWPIGTAVLKGQ